MKGGLEMEAEDDDLDRISQRHTSKLTFHNAEFIVYYMDQFNADTVEFLNSHQNYEIYYILNGTIKSFVNGEILVLHKGDLLFISCDVPHNTIFEPSENKDYLTFGFNFNIITKKRIKVNDYDPEENEIKDILYLLSKKKYIVVRNNFDAYDMLNELKLEMKYQNTGWHMMVNSIYFNFFTKAIRQIDRGKLGQTSPENNQNLGLKATKFIHSNYQKDISLETVAEFLHISSRHVNRVFRKMFNATFSKTLSHVRIDYAKKYLYTTDYTIEKISELVGFNSSRTLYKLFKEYEHMTISEYRKAKVSEIHS